VIDLPIDKVDVHDAGHRIVLSCEDPEHLRAVMESLRTEGAQKVQMPARVGGRWIASFENPAIRRCTVETFGYRILISGPEREAVFARAQEHRERGAQIVRGPVKEGPVWRVYLEDIALFDTPRAMLDQEQARRIP
jgi:hypothetical protein